MFCPTNSGTLSSWNSAFSESFSNPNLGSDRDEAAVAAAAQSDKIGYSPKLLPRVFEEIRLLRADALFNLCLSRFAHEMMKDENMYVGGGDEVTEEAAAEAEQERRLAEGALFNRPAVRAEEMKLILQFTEECSYVSPRLVLPSVYHRLRSLECVCAAARSSIDCWRRSAWLWSCGSSTGTNRTR